MRSLQALYTLFTIQNLFHLQTVLFTLQISVSMQGKQKVIDF